MSARPSRALRHKVFMLPHVSGWWRRSSYICYRLEELSDYLLSPRKRSFYGSQRKSGFDHITHTYCHIRTAVYGENLHEKNHISKFSTWTIISLQCTLLIFLSSTGNQSVVDGLMTRLDLRVKSELLFSKDTMKTTQIFKEEHFPLTILTLGRLDL